MPKRSGKSRKGKKNTKPECSKCQKETEHISSLTSPLDQKDREPWKGSELPPLTGDDAKDADPPYSNQVYALVSFVPSSTATPDANGIYGMIKVRGVFPDLNEANQRAEWLIRNVDSYHKIYTVFVGRPFPATVSSDYSSETNDTQQQITDILNSDVKKKREDEKRIMKEIKEREEKLKEDVTSEPDPLDEYVHVSILDF